MTKGRIKKGVEGKFSEYHSIDWACEQVGVDGSTMRNWVKTKKIKPVAEIGGHVFVHESFKIYAKIVFDPKKAEAFLSRLATPARVPGI